MSAPAAAPAVIAPAGETCCGERSEQGAYCERPKDHKGGHLSQSRNAYWQAT